jgi:hypothetical protein
MMERTESVISRIAGRFSSKDSSWATIVGLEQ